MTKEQISRLSENQLKTIWNNILITKNLVNIQQVKGKDLEIVDTDKYDYILTYSFPCQDLSLAGKGKGMSDTSTRSGMLWEVERILQECKDLGELPQILLMENVPQVKSNDPRAWEKWLSRLEELGYKNYHKDLIATDYGIPQTRNRCFMVSILGDYSYTFPKPIPLKLKLKDMLEGNVDEKYYLSDKLLKYYEKKIEQGWRKELHTSEDIAMTICNPGRNQINDNFIKIKNATNGGNDRGVVNSDLRIRKLTPRECGRLMGVKDEDITNMLKNQSDSSAYHCFGDSICTNVLMAIFGELLEIEWEKYLNN